MTKHTDTSKDYFTRYSLAVEALNKDVSSAELAIHALDLVERLLVERGYQEDSSTRHNLAHARAWINDIVTRNTNRHEVMNPPASAAMGVEARNLTSATAMGLGEVHRASEARPADDAPAPTSCPVCSCSVGIRQRQPRCANCGWLGPVKLGGSES